MQITNNGNIRITYFDFLRGIAIMMVVAIHSFPNSGIRHLNEVEVFIRQIFNCAVPLFLAIFGYFVVNKPEHIIKKILKVYVPCIFWSLFWFAWSIHGGLEIWKSMLLLVTCGFSVYYFIALIIQYYIELPVIKNIKYGGVVLSIIISMFSITLVTYLKTIKGYNMPLLIYAGTFVVWQMFFSIGCYLGIDSARPNYKLLFPMVLTMIGLILSHIESIYLYTKYNDGFGIKPSSFIFSFAIILVLLSNRVQRIYKENNKINKLIVKIGNVSFGIYLVHLFFMTILLHLYSSWCWITLFISTLFVTILFIVIVKVTMPKILVKYLGFR